MTRFSDGPATNITLLLCRSPLYLRVVQSPDKKFDALDQLDDSPAMDESVFVYRRASHDGTVHVDYTEKGRRRGAWYSCATYQLAPMQPDESVARDQASWRAWCIEARKQESRIS